MIRNYITNPLDKYEKPLKDDLVYLYIDLNLTAEEISELYITNKAKRTIENYLKYYGIKKPLELVKVRRKQTCLEKYGGVAPACSKEIQTKMKQTNLKRYNGVAPACSNDIKSKTKETNLEKYGVEYYTQTKKYKVKTKETNLEKYGVEYSFQSNDIKNKIKQTNMERYGVENPFQSEEIKGKIKQTNLERYGSENPFQSDEIKEQIKQTNLERYGVEYLQQKHISKETLEILQNKDELIKLFEDNNTKSRQIIANKLGISKTLIEKYLKIHNVIDNYKLSGSSYYEEEIANKIREFYNGEIITNARILYGKEIDIYIPEYKLGIEFNGTHWHSEQILLKKGHNPITYHYEKSMLAKEQGIFLLHIFEYDYIKNKNKYIDHIKQIMGLVNKIPYSDCIIKLVDINEYNNFIKEYSLQETDISTIRLGLYYNNELVEVIAFNKLFKNKYELVNHCFKQNIMIINGTINLFNYFVNIYKPKSIISYNPIHLKSGDIYNTLNFDYDHKTVPSYVYINNDKIYDCGSIVWIWINKNGGKYKSTTI